MKAFDSPLRLCAYLAFLCLAASCIFEPSRRAEFFITNGSGTDSLIVTFSFGDKSEIDAVRLTKNRSFKIWQKVLNDKDVYNKELFDAFRDYFGNKRNLAISVLKSGSDSVLCHWEYDSAIPDELVFYDSAYWDATITSQYKSFGTSPLESNIDWNFTFTITDEMLKQNDNSESPTAVWFGAEPQ